MQTASILAHAPMVAPKFQAKSCQKTDRDMDFFISQMWRAFPDARSEAQLADLVAAHLTKKAKPVDARTVRYWLRHETTPHFRHVAPILILAGSEAVLEWLFGTGGRS